MKLLSRFVKLTWPLLLVLISGLPVSFKCVLLLSLLIMFLLLLVVVTFLPASKGKIERVFDVIEQPCHCSRRVRCPHPHE